MPFATLAHELGHAALALRAGPGSVIIQVGRPPSWFELAFECLTIRWSPRPMRGVPFAGICVWNPRDTDPGALFAIAVAGPIVTALLIPVFVLAAFAFAGSAPWITASWGMSAFCCFTSLRINADPRPANDAERANPGAPAIAPGDNTVRGRIEDSTIGGASPPPRRLALPSGLRMRPANAHLSRGKEMDWLPRLLALREQWI